MIYLYKCSEFVTIDINSIWSSHTRYILKIFKKNIKYSFIK